jgi:hypothetical protein
MTKRKSKNDLPPLEAGTRVVTVGNKKSKAWGVIAHGNPGTVLEVDEKLLEPYGVLLDRGIAYWFKREELAVQTEEPQ